MTPEQAKALVHYGQLALEALQRKPDWDDLPTIIRHLPDAWCDEQLQLVLSALVSKIAGGYHVQACIDALLEAHEALDDNRSESEVMSDDEALAADRKRWERKERDL